MKTKTDRTGRQIAASLALSAFLALLGNPVSAQNSPLSFSKSFGPSTIGPGSISTLTFTIGSTSPSPVSDLAFTDNLPTGMTIAEPAGATTDCGASAQVTAPSGGSTITLTDGSLPAAVEFVSCQVTVNVTASTPGTLNNTSGSLTSDQGSAPAASADLTVDASRPGISKSFSPDSIVINETSTLTFTIDNSLAGANVSSISFTDPLPQGLQVASPANTSMTCPGGSLSATSGATSIGFFGGAVLAGQTCTVSVDVVADDNAGRRENLTSDATSFVGSLGKAGDVLDVRIDPLIKLFTDNPVPPGGTATLEFQIRNLDRTDSLTDISFTDDLDATLSGLTVVPPLPSEPCGTGSTLSGTSFLTLSGGSLPPGAACTFEVAVQVPAGASAGSYPNTTSSMSAQLGGTPVNFDPASDDLIVDVVPLMTKTFLSPVVGAGGTVDVEFSISNSSTTSSASGISFSDNLSAFLPGTTAAVLPTSPCGGSIQQLNNFPSTGDVSLLLSNGSLGPGASCSFTVTLQLQDGVPYGVYDNVTSDVSADIDGVTRVGPPASDSLEVVSAPTLGKEFIDDPVDPGATATLQFTLTHDEFAPADATSIAFTDDLDAALTGLTAIGLPQNDVCGTGSQLSGTSTISFSGGTLAPGDSCTFSVTVQTPAGAPPGAHSNTTSATTATVSGVSTTGLAASDDLLITGLEATKQFLDDSVLPGQTTTLRFTLSNDNPDLTATDIAFSDNLGSALSGLASTSGTLNDICGTGSSITGTNNLFFTGGSLAPGSSCTFDVTVQVPAGAASGNYSNFTTAVQATYDGSILTFDPAAAELEVNDSIIDLDKQFIDDPVAPGASVTLEFTIGNISSDDDITGITFTDDLDAALTGLTSVSGTLNDVCGSGSQLSGTSLLTLTGGNLLAGQSCTFSVTLSVPASIPSGSTAVNTTSPASGSVGGIAVTGAPATDDLAINQIAFGKAFDGPTVAGATLGLTFTLENQGSSTVSGLAFTDDLDAVLPGLVASNLPPPDPCGIGSQISGSSLLTFSGGELAPGESCSFQVGLAVPAGATAGLYTNTSSDLTSGGLLVSGPASAQFSVEPPPGFSKTFAPATIGVDGASTLTFAIDNSASALAANSLAFSDPLPAGTVVAPTPNAGSTCGGTVTAGAGNGTIQFSGGSVAAGGSCTVSVDVTATAEGNYTNVSGALTSSSGDSGTATADLEAVDTAFTVSKAFASQPVIPGGLVDLEITIDNASQFALNDIALSDDLDAALGGLAAEGLPLADVCGTGSQVSGSTIVNLSGASLAAGASCNFVVPVRVPGNAAGGTYTNTTSAATGTRQGVSVQAPAASADLVVEALGFDKSIAPANVAPGDTIDITFVINNPDPVNTAEGLNFTDDLDAFIPGMTTSDTPQLDVCGAGSTLEGTSLIELTRGIVPPSGSCTITLTATVPADAAPGNYTNTTSVLAGDVGGSGFDAASASAPLGIAGAPVFTKTFAPDQVALEQASTLTFTIDNSAETLAADSLAFVDPLPTGLLVASTPNVSNACGGTLSAGAGASSISLSGGSVAAGAQCTISVDVASDTPGTFNNVTGDLTSSLGNSGTASAALEVAEIPVFSKSFTPDAIEAGQTSRLTFIIDNSANSVQADSLAFVDPFPAGLQVASPPDAANSCGGTFSAAAGADTVSLSGGSVAAGAQCTLSVDVIGIDAGSLTNVTGDLTSSLGNSGAATATLTQFFSVPTIDQRWMLLLAMLLGLAAWLHVRRH